MLRNSLLLLVLGLFASVVVPKIATAAIWSVKADCKNGDWTVSVDLAGVGPVDASCIDGTETHFPVDVGDLIVTGGSIAATSSGGTMCDLPRGSDFKFTLECASKTEDSAGFELEEKVEVEVELEEEEEAEE
jgi:hypothetical protein